MALTQTRLPNVSNFAEEKFQLSSLVCTCTTMNSSLIQPYFKRICEPIIVNPDRPGNMMNRSAPNQFYIKALRKVLLCVCGPTHRRAIKVSNEAEGFSGDPLPLSNTHSVWKNNILMHNFGNNALAKHRFAMERQCLSEVFSKENDDVIWRFMTWKHATSRYIVVHGNRFHTRIS